MSRTIMLIPIGNCINLTSIILGMILAIKRKGIRLGIFKPISQVYTENDISEKIILKICKNENLLIAEPMKMSRAEFLLSRNQQDLLMEEIISNYQSSNTDAKVILVEGLITTIEHYFAQSLNYEIAKMLNAEIVFVISHHSSDSLEKIKRRIELTRINFGDTKNTNVSGIIINNLNAPTPITEKKEISTKIHFSEIFDNSCTIQKTEIDPDNIIKSSPFPVLGMIPWNLELMTVRAIDIARYLNATVVNTGDINVRRINSITFCTSHALHVLGDCHTGSLLIISKDNPELLITACLAVMSGVKIGAILLTDGYQIDNSIKKLCACAFSTGLPVYMVNTNIWKTSVNLHNFNMKIPCDDYERIEKVQEYVAECINVDWIAYTNDVTSKKNFRLSPPAFRYQLINLAQKSNKRIVLPEGDEPRTIKAASICAERKIATCILLGNPDKIYSLAKSQDIDLGSTTKIINPEFIRENYVNRLIDLRRDKGMTEEEARNQLEDNVTLGTLMLEKDEVDGMVSGAVHTTANTIRPPMQLIKVAPGSSLISSIFFMLFPEQVYVYGDCAINQDPTAEQLSEIAIQSADTASLFGIVPYIAMLSYSTGTSAFGSHVEKVRQATYLARKKRPDLVIDGPLQYDAAVIDEVAKLKAPNSPVAGKATVFIFPDLNTGNITYKAVQRSANLISIGPILQGIGKPVNDLSRGALVDDIIYTIALTAIQSIARMNQ